jgi:hypothetical protein
MRVCSGVQGHQHAAGWVRATADVGLWCPKARPALLAQVVSPSKWTVQGITAGATSEGVLSAAFSIVLPKTQLISNLSGIWAFGPLAADGSLEAHSVRAAPNPEGPSFQSGQPRHLCRELPRERKLILWRGSGGWGVGGTCQSRARQDFHENTQTINSKRRHFKVSCLLVAEMQGNGFQNNFQDLSGSVQVGAPPAPSAQASCSLDLGSATLAYESCTSLGGQTGSMEFLWTYHAANSTLDAAFWGYNPGAAL